MKILFLGPAKKPQKMVIEFLLNNGNFVRRLERELSAEDISEFKYEFLISYGYRYILSKEILDYFKGKTINLHISYLPWNKGADPNLWSFLEATPKGVTIHRIDSGLDTGEILCQKKVVFSKKETLKSSYNKLQDAIVQLFKENWELVKCSKVTPVSQKGKGSYHKSADKNDYMKLLTDGWDTEIKNLEGKALHG